jgi:hypothetical protein
MLRPMDALAERLFQSGAIPRWAQNSQRLHNPKPTAYFNSTVYYGAVGDQIKAITRIYSYRPCLPASIPLSRGYAKHFRKRHECCDPLVRGERLLSHAARLRCNRPLKELYNSNQASSGGRPTELFLKAIQSCDSFQSLAGDRRCVRLLQAVELAPHVRPISDFLNAAIRPMQIGRSGRS